MSDSEKSQCFFVERPERVEEKMASMSLQDDPRIPEGFVNVSNSDKLVGFGEMVTVFNDSTLFRCANVESLSHFYVTLSPSVLEKHITWLLSESSEVFNKRMMEFYGSVGLIDWTLDESVPTRECLKEGLVVACQYRDKWQRGKIVGIRKTDEKELFQMFMIDHGRKALVPIDNIRYLHKSMMNFAVRSIRCSLKIMNKKLQKMVSDSQKKPCDQRMVLEFRNLLAEKDIHLRFGEQIEVEQGERAWKVCVEIPATNFGYSGEIQYHHSNVEAKLLAVGGPPIQTISDAKKMKT